MNYFRYACLMPMFFALLSGTVRSQTVRVENVQAAMGSGGMVVITYDLLGAADEEYDVEVFLVMVQQGAPLRRKLAQVTGDVGEVQGSGKGRKILWNMNAELRDPVPGLEYQFEVSAAITGGGLSWYLYAGAAVVVGGIAILAIKPPAEVAEPPAIVKTIPLPPGR